MRAKGNNTKISLSATGKPIDYRSAGVNIEAGNSAVDRIRPHVETTFNESVLEGIGGFGSFFDLKKLLRDYKDPVLVQSTDSVGTKISVASMSQNFSTIGMDLVSACCNDILVHGARPLTFLDYIATGNLKPEIIEEIVRGIAEACRHHGVALVGGELAEMPDTYVNGEYDLVGIVTGVVEKQKIINGKNIITGDSVLALPSNGLHTNGYSLARKLIFEVAKLTIEDRPEPLSESVSETLLAPHLNYQDPILTLLEAGHLVKGMAHITGGGIFDNIPRILPANCGAEIFRGTWPIPPVFTLLKRLSNLPEKEMFRTFNMGLGLVMVVSPETSSEIIHCLSPETDIFEVGTIIDADHEVRLVEAPSTKHL